MYVCMYVHVHVGVCINVVLVFQHNSYQVALKYASSNSV